MNKSSLHSFAAFIIIGGILLYFVSFFITLKEIGNDSSSLFTAIITLATGVFTTVLIGIVLSSLGRVVDNTNELLRRSKDIKDSTNEPGEEIKETPTDPKVLELIEKANNGDVDAMFKLCDCYQTGDGVKQSTAEANEWFNKAMNAKK